jgi:diguanylate cyclase (GGDEF)-like protein/PAS domain S-box-containing protein
MTSNKDIYASIFNNAIQAIILIDRHGIIRDVNPACEEIFGYSQEQLLDQNVSLLMDPPYRDEHDGYIESFLATGEARVIGTGRELLGRHRDGSPIPIELAVSQVVVGEETLFVGMVNDISARKESERLLYLNNKVMRAINAALGGFINANMARKEIFDNLLEKLLDITDSEYGFIGEILHKDDQTPYLKTYAITNIAWNHDTRKLYKENVRNGLEFHNLDTLFGITIRTGEVVISNNPGDDPRSGGMPKGHPSLDAYLGLPLYSGNKLIGMAGISNRPGGYDEELADLLKPLLGTIGSLIAGYQNLHSRRKAEQALYRAQAKLRQMATQDALTGIANRSSLIDQLSDAFEHSKRHGDNFSLLFLDIDHFKSINDDYGHQVGDKALQHAVTVIREHMRPSDIFGRYGGEEFVLGLLDCDAESARHCAERFRAAMQGSSVATDSDGTVINMTISVGVATLDEATTDIDAFINNADQAVYAAKRAGRNCVRSFSRGSTETLEAEPV